MLRVGVIGGGYGAAIHLPALRGLAGVRVAAVADGGSGRITAAASGVPYHPSWRGLLDTAEIDAVTIATPPLLHAPIVSAALARGLHVLCEKPFGRDANEAAAMTAFAGAKIGAVGYQFRYEPGLRALREILHDGTIGRPRKIAIVWTTAGRADPNRPWGFQHDAAAGGGAIEGFLCHCLDYALWLTGAVPRRVWARGDILVPNRLDTAGRERAVTAEDSVDAVLELAGDIVVTASVTNCQPGGDTHRITLFGDAGIAELDQRIPAGPHRLTVRAAETSALELPATGADSRIAAFAALAADFAAAIAGAPAPDLPRFADGLRVRTILDALHRAVAEGSWQACAAPVQTPR